MAIPYLVSSIANDNDRWSVGSSGSIQFNLGEEGFAWKPDDLAIAVWGTHPTSTATTFSDLTGWTKSSKLTQTLPDSSLLEVVYYYKILEEGDGSTVTFSKTGGGAGSGGGSLYIFRGANTTTPLQTTSTSTITSATATGTSPAITTTTANTAILRVMQIESTGGSGIDWIGNETGDESSGNNLGYRFGGGSENTGSAQGLAGWTYLKETAGSTGTATVVNSQGASQWNALTFAIIPDNLGAVDAPTSSTTLNIFGDTSDKVNVGEAWYIEVTDGEITGVTSTGDIQGTSWTADLWVFRGIWQKIAVLSTADVEVSGVEITSYPEDTAESFVNYVSPNLSLGDYVIADAVTKPGGYTFTVRGDGTYVYNANGDKTRQSVNVVLYRTADAEYTQPVYFFINNIKPIFGDGTNTPINFSANYGDSVSIPLNEYFQSPYEDVLYYVISPLSETLGDDLFSTYTITGPSGSDDPESEVIRVRDEGGELIGVINASSGTYRLTIRAFDGAGDFVDGTFIFAVSGTPVVIDPTLLENISLTQGQFFTFDCKRMFTTSNYVWTIAGNIPPGLSINSSTGILSGIPTQTGTYDFNVVATNSAGSAYVGANFNVRQATAVAPSFTLNSYSYLPGSIATLTFSPTPEIPPTSVTIDGIELSFFEQPSGNTAKIRIPTAMDFLSGEYKTIPWNRAIPITVNFPGGSSNSLIIISGPISSNRAGATYWYGTTPENPQGIFKNLDPGTFWVIQVQSGRIETITNGQLAISQTGTIKAWVFPASGD